MEVEKTEALGGLLDNVVVGVVKKISKHPDADRLQVCVVDDGTGEQQVVCGGSNVREGMSVAFGRVGAHVRWHGQGEPVELKKTTIRGVESHGMICASSEIGLEEQFPQKEEREILDLSAVSALPGTPVAHALCMDDVIFHIDNKAL